MIPAKGPSSTHPGMGSDAMVQLTIILKEHPGAGCAQSSAKKSFGPCSKGEKKRLAAASRSSDSLRPARLPPR